MAIFVNKTLAKISASVEGKMYDFIPGMMTIVDDNDHVRALKKVPLIARSIDKENIITGLAAKKLANQTDKEVKDLKKKAKKDEESEDDESEDDESEDDDSEDEQ